MFYRQSKGFVFIDIFSYLFVLANLYYFLYSFYSEKINLDVVLREDYIFEWATFFFLLFTSLTFFLFSYKFRGHKAYLILFSFFSFLFLFGALEEVSYFQRFFMFSGSDVVVSNNSQGEFNIHNLVIGQTSINKLIFGKILGLIIGIYFVVPSVVKELSREGGLFFKGLFFPTPYMRDLILILIITTTVYLFLDFPKQGEILEYLISFQLLCFFTKEFLKQKEL